jgi:hypothetical protein
MKRKTKVNKIKIGNDGYGSRNVTVTQEKYGVEIVQTSAHNWGRISGRTFILNESIDELIVFLINMKQTAGQD